MSSNIFCHKCTSHHVHHHSSNNSNAYGTFDSRQMKGAPLHLMNDCISFFSVHFFSSVNLARPLFLCLCLVPESRTLLSVVIVPAGLAFPIQTLCYCFHDNMAGGHRRVFCLLSPPDTLNLITSTLLI